MGDVGRGRGSGRTCAAAHSLWSGLERDFWFRLHLQVGLFGFTDRWEN